MDIPTTPLIIEVTLNGSAPKSKNPSTQYSDDEIVTQAFACMKAGAALVHNHTEEPVFGATGSMNAERYAKLWRRILELRPMPS